MIKSYLDRGDLVPDGVVMDMLRKPVVAAAQAGGYVLDGFPRTVEQARASFPTAHALGVAVQVAVHLDVGRTELVRRLLARRRGSEDTEAIIERRLEVYLDKTLPLLDYYADREWMFTVDGAQPPDAVHEDIVACLRNMADFALWARRGAGLCGWARLILNQPSASRMAPTASQPSSLRTSVPAPCLSGRRRTRSTRPGCPRHAGRRPRRRDTEPRSSGPFREGAANQ